MAILNPQHKRRVRIESKPGESIGWMVRIRDTETGEEIKNVFRAVITLDARELNAVELSFYESTEDGHVIAGDDGDPIVRRVKLHFPEVEVDAWEVMP